jgi:hypothetical protein
MVFTISQMVVLTRCEFVYPAKQANRVAEIKPQVVKYCDSY